MTLFLEKSAFLRTLNFTRVQHEYRTRYFLLYPIVLASIFLCASIIKSNQTSDSIVKVLSELAEIFPMLIPFFIASLAAISTFPGPDAIDQEFSMTEPVTLEILGKGGQAEHMHVTPRHFLSLLFSYCTVLSFLLFISNLFIPSLLTAAFCNPLWLKTSNLVFAAIYLFFVSQVFVSALLAIYYLSDYLARKR